MTEEARLGQTDSGLKPSTEGWFVVNVGETGWAVHDAFGAGCTFEGGDAQFKQLGINISVVEPGQPLCLYHEESAQEGFLVLSGECVLLVNERRAAAQGLGLLPLPAGRRARDRRRRRRPRDRARGRRSARGRAHQLSAVGARRALWRQCGRDHHRPQEAYSRAGHNRPRHERPAYWDKLPWAK